MVNTISNNLITFKSDVNPTSKNNIAKNNSSTLSNIPKENDENKKSSLPLARKLGIGFVSAFALFYATFAGILIYKKPNFSKLQKGLSEILRKDLSENDTKQIIAQYKDLLKINDPETFTRNAFEQIKKDYGYENADIHLVINYTDKIAVSNPLKRRNIKLCKGEYNFQNVEVMINQNFKQNRKMDTFDKADTLDVLFHELKHFEQSALCYQSDKEKFLNIILKNPFIDLLKKLNPDYKPKDSISVIEDNYQRALKNVPSKDITKHSKKIDEYMTNIDNYVDAEINYNGYRNQVIEQEAFFAGDIGDKIAWYDKTQNSLFIPKAKSIVLFGVPAALCFAKDGYDTFYKTNVK